MTKTKRAAKKVCKICGKDSKTYGWIDWTKIDGGYLCQDDTDCPACAANLPKKLLGRKGAGGGASLCAKCHKKARAARPKLLRLNVTPASGPFRLLKMRSKKDHRLASYVRLEKKGEGGITFIEFGVFHERGAWSKEQEAIMAIGTSPVILKNGVERSFLRLNSKMVSRRQTAYNLKETVVWNGVNRRGGIDYDKWGFDKMRFIERPIKLLRRLGYRVTARRARGKYQGPHLYEDMTWAEEARARQIEFVEANLSTKYKTIINKIDAKNARAIKKLDKIADNFINETVEEVEDPNMLIHGVPAAT